MAARTKASGGCTLGTLAAPEGPPDCLTWPVVVLIAEHLHSEGTKICGADAGHASRAAVMQFDTYCRPDELLCLSLSDLTPPVWRPPWQKSQAADTWSLMVRPHRQIREGEALDLRRANGKAASEARPNKQGVYDNAVLIGQPASAASGRSIVPLICAFLYMGKHLEYLESGRNMFRSKTRLLEGSSQMSPDTPCFPISYNRYVACLRWAVKSLKIPCVSNPHALRHGGPSADFFLGVRSIAEIRDRGKWQSEVSCSRYRQAGRYQRELNKLTAEQLARADHIEVWGLHFLIR